MTAFKLTPPEIFDLINERLDGCGMIVTDPDLLAEAIAEQHGFDPEDVYKNYEPPEEDDE
jgi:hypothetical protein